MDIRQGEDKVFEILVTDENNNFVILDAPDVVTIRVWLKVGDKIIQRFRTGTPPVGWFLATINATNNSKLDLIINNLESAEYPTGTINASVAIDYDDPLFEDNIRRVEYKYCKLGNVFCGDSRFLGNNC